MGRTPYVKVFVFQPHYFRPPDARERTSDRRAAFAARSFGSLVQPTAYFKNVNKSKP
jgi:hypothetical protein